MRQSDSRSANSNSTRWFDWIERRVAALWKFIVDFWLVLLFAIVLGLLFIYLPQSLEIWRYYILSFPPAPADALPALIHALIVVAAFLFSGIVFAKAAHRKVLLRDARDETGRSSMSWLLPFAALLPIVLTLLGALYAASLYIDVGEVEVQMRAAFFLSLGLIALALLAVRARANSSGAALARLFADGRSFNRMVALAALALLVIFLALPLLPSPHFVGAAQIMGALPAFLFSLALLMYGIDAALGASGKRRIVALAAVAVTVAGVLFGDLTAAHYVRARDIPRKHPFPDVGNEFLRWLEAREDKDKYDRYPVFIVAAQGGGLFSAYHTARVLANLQDQCPTFAQHVFAISGVSGGSLGAAVFASAVKSISPKQNSQPCKGIGTRKEGEFLRYTDRFLKRDLASPLAFLSIIPNIAQRVLGLLPQGLLALPPVEAFLGDRIVGRYDRALGLEYGFEQAWHAADANSGNRRNFFEESSHDAWTGKDAVPALILNAARADTGITYSVAPFRLNTEDEPKLDFRAKVLAVEAPTVDVSISTAVGLSARYPFITAPGMINVAARKWLRDQGEETWIRKRRRQKQGDTTEIIGLVDGGFVENSGLATVEKLLKEIHNAVARQKDKDTRVSIHVIAIQDLSAFTYAHSGVEDGTFVPKAMKDLVEWKDLNEESPRGFVEFTAPLTALDASRSARSFYSLNSLIETVQTLRCAQGVDETCGASQPPIVSRSGQVIEVNPVGDLFGLTANNRPLPLTWQLSRLSWQRIAGRAWADEREDRTPGGWACLQQKARKMDEKNKEELRGLGEDLGAFVDRWHYACGRVRVHNVLKEMKSAGAQ